MKVNAMTPMSARQRAKRLKLQSSRFYEGRMSRNALQAIQQIKRKDRNDLKLQQWQGKQYYKTDFTKQLFDCPEDIQRRDAESLSVEEFVQKYEKTKKPVIIRGLTKDWKCESKWTHQYFYRKFKNFRFKVGEDDDGHKLKVPFKYYLQYLVHNRDDSPLYLFESSLEDKEETRLIMDNYIVPPYFKDDLFKLAGQRKRPPYRWFIMGPQRSGTTIHTDPLMTSAWNTSLAGHKRWLLFSSHIPKSIVKGKQFRPKNYTDQAINYFADILPKIKQKYSRQQLEIIQFIQKPGETVFVPGGLWHAVINLDDTIAVTQNVMTHYCFDAVWRSTRCQRRKFAKGFLQKLQANEQQLYNRAIQMNRLDEFKMGNKYCKQQVSLSFTPSSSSSSSSSSSKSSQRKSKSSSDSDKKINYVLSKKKKNDKKSNSIQRSRSRSRSRQRNQRRNYSQQKNSSKTKKGWQN